MELEELKPWRKLVTNLPPEPPPPPPTEPAPPIREIKPSPAIFFVITWILPPAPPPEPKVPFEPD
jgi:hypothetical protein